MKTFSEFMTIAEAVEDKSKALGFAATIKTAQAGGRVRPERKKSAPEKRRMAQAKPGEERKPSNYKPRKDIGQQRSSETRTQQPEQERGSARERQLAAAKEERRKAAQARSAAKKTGESTPAAKPKAKEIAKTASKLLSTKKSDVDKRPSDQPKRAVVGMSREARKDITRRGHRKLEQLVRQSEAEKQGKKPEQVQLKHDYRPK
jgi:hypothetical protein